VEDVLVTPLKLELVKQNLPRLNNLVTAATT
jgi:hypothetical protein